jgi:hypothetical protein
VLTCIGNVQATAFRTLIELEEKLEEELDAMSLALLEDAVREPLVPPGGVAAAGARREAW